MDSFFNGKGVWESAESYLQTFQYFEVGEVGQVPIDDTGTRYRTRYRTYHLSP